LCPITPPKSPLGIVRHRCQRTFCSITPAEGSTLDDKSPEFQIRLPRCDKMDGSTLRIVPSYTEAGMFCEANCVTITDGERTALYVPLRIVTNDELEAERANDPQ